jgi:hypothetical protein
MTMKTNILPRIDRRTAIRWMLAASASSLLWDQRLLGAPASPATPGGYGPDPDLARAYKPGDIWPLTLTDAQRGTVTALCDLVIPADGGSPSASTVGVPDFVDEWISAPYPTQIKDRQVILEGLAWLDAESMRRFGFDFASGGHREMTGICDDICSEAAAKPKFKTAAQFFDRFRSICTGGFYITPEGTRDIGYVGNVALTRFDGPPAEILKKLGIVD